MSKAPDQSGRASGLFLVERVFRPGDVEFIGSATTLRQHGAGINQAPYRGPLRPSGPFAGLAL